MAQGPLAGLRIVEMEGLGPAPFCGMLLADLGADIVRIDRTADAGLGVARDPKFDLNSRSRRSVAVDMKRPEGVALVRGLIRKADALIEGFRPGVMERFGLGPEICLGDNPKLVYGRMTGWGQTGPLAKAAGHDINYISLTGALHAMGRAGDKPLPPLNLVGDYGGGALYLAVGVLAGLWHAQRTGKGQVVDAAMVDGAASLMSIFYGLLAQGVWQDQRGVNLLDTGAPWYESYETKDGKFISLGPIEPKFYAEFLKVAELDQAGLPDQYDRARWPELRAKLAEAIRKRTRDVWVAALEGTDACFAPVLSMAEAPRHPHNVARGTFVEVDGVVQPGPAPRFSATPGKVQGPPPRRGEHTATALRDWGIAATQIAQLKQNGVIA